MHVVRASVYAAVYGDDKRTQTQQKSHCQVAESHSVGFFATVSINPFIPFLSGTVFSTICFVAFSRIVYQMYLLDPVNAFFFYHDDLYVVA